MCVKNLPDDLLLEKTIEASRKEKSATLELLEYLAEMYVRRLADARGYSDLYDFLIRKLHYSESQASERMSAVRLMIRVPEIKERLSQDSVSLTSIVKLASFVRRENCSVEKASELLSAISDKSTREAERVLASEQTVPVHKPDVIKPAGPETTRISFDADPEFLDLLEEMKNLQGSGSLTLNERLKDAMRVLIEKKKSRHVMKRKPAHEKAAPSTDPSESVVSNEKLRAHETNGKTDADRQENGKREGRQPHSRYWPIAARDYAMKRANGCCEFVDPLSGRRCESRKALEFDHVLPFAKGGSSTAENIRVLCRNHNRFEAVREFGAEKLRKFSG